jgi:hypothetical protein
MITISGTRNVLASPVGALPIWLALVVIVGLGAVITVGFVRRLFSWPRTDILGGVDADDLLDATVAAGIHDAPVLPRLPYTEANPRCTLLFQTRPQPQDTANT